MEFTQAFRDQLAELLAWRRDVRRFRPDPVAPELIRRLLDQTCLAPSVGLSEPWRFVMVESDTARAASLANFEAANAEALAGYSGDQQKLYATLKLSGMREAPVQIAIFCDEATSQGSGVGIQTMPEMRRYSVVCAVMQLWLAARAEGLGAGWVSILDPDRLSASLGVAQDWRLISYLCLGWPEEEHRDTELERVGWENRRGVDIRILTR
ncbi:MAG: 5,6-dimethylbenzimidazole synthase [Alphaproteobacteria bacterium]